jgi:hypothetical protein
MFGCFALYLNKRLVFIVRKRKTHTDINGVWIATSRAHHRSLLNEFPSMRSISILGKDPTNWQMIPESAEDFEESTIRACTLVVKGDPRIGVVPGKRKTR